MNFTIKSLLSASTLIFAINTQAHLSGPTGGLSPRYSGTGVPASDAYTPAVEARTAEIRSGQVASDKADAARASQPRAAYSKPNIGFGAGEITAEKARSSVVGILRDNPNLNQQSVAQYVENLSNTTRSPLTGSTQFTLGNIIEKDPKIAKMAKGLLGVASSEKLALGSKETTDLAKIFSDYYHGAPLTKEQLKFVNAAVLATDSSNAKNIIKDSVLLTERVEGNKEFMKATKLTIGQNTVALRKFAELHLAGSDLSKLNHQDLLALLEKNVQATNASQFKDLAGKAAVFEGQINIATEAASKGGSLASNLAAAMKLSPKVALAASKFGGYFASGFGKLAVFAVLGGAVAIAEANEREKPTIDLGTAEVESNVEVRRSSKGKANSVNAAN